MNFEKNPREMMLLYPTSMSAVIYSQLSKKRTRSSHATSEVPSARDIQFIVLEEEICFKISSISLFITTEGCEIPLSKGLWPQVTLRRAARQHLRASALLQVFLCYKYLCFRPGLCPLDLVFVLST